MCGIAVPLEGQHSDMAVILRRGTEEFERLAPEDRAMRREQHIETGGCGTHRCCAAIDQHRQETGETWIVFQQRLRPEPGEQRLNGKAHLVETPPCLNAGATAVSGFRVAAKH